MLKSTTISSAENYDSTSVHQQQHTFLELVSSIKINCGFKCLDIGCGTGNNTVLLADLVGEDGHVVGVDPDEKRIAVAIKKYKHLVNLSFLVGKSVDFPFRNGGYDLIVSNMVMHWVQYDKKVETYKMVFNALKPGGLFANDEVSRRTEVICRFLSFTTKEVCDLINNSVFCISPENNREMFANLGFEIVQLNEIKRRKCFQSLDLYFTWIDATLHGYVDSKKIYNENKGGMNLQINDEGSVVHETYHNKIIVRKPI